MICEYHETDSFTLFVLDLLVLHSLASQECWRVVQLVEKCLAI